MPSRDQIESDVRAVLREQARVPVDTLAIDADLFQAGMSSHDSVNLMLALEDKFELEFPERMLNRRAFESIAALVAALEELTAGAR